MSKVSYDLEALIVRHLDSELTEEQELELNRELIRNPEAQQMLADYRQADQLAVAALNQVIPGEEGLKPVPMPAVTSPPRRAGHYRAWWIIPGAVAAAIMALMIPNPSVAPRQDGRVQITSAPPSPHSRINESQRGSAQGLTRNVSTYPVGPRIKRDTGREVFGVVGDDGNVYWIQVDRIRTLKRPGRHVAGWPANEAM